MERRFGYDFSHVRVHHDDAAAQSAREVSARAYTAGQHVVFGAGQFEPDSEAGGRLLAHELTHVTQQCGRMAAIQRTPKEKDERRSEAAARQRGRVIAAKIKKEGKLSDASKSQLVRDLDFFQGTARETYIKVAGPTLRQVTGNDISSSVPVLTELASEFSETFLPVLSGGKELLAGGRPEEVEPAEVLDARKAFRAEHEGHGEEVLNNIDMSLKRVTSNNPKLLVAYYRYYATHKLTDKLPWNMSDDIYTGATEHGDTDINPDVLSYRSKFSTDSPISLLGSTLLHEYSHTLQSNPMDPISEAKAYGIEWFFAERSRDQARVDFIDRRYARANRDERRMLYFSYYTLRELYKVIDAGGAAADEARDMSVEYISKNASDYRPKLKDLFREVSAFYVP
jgi:hypothetical protein